MVEVVEVEVVEVVKGGKVGGCCGVGDGGGGT
jgi:hypothetical protein